jgi:hypothetical protein
MKRTLNFFLRPKEFLLDFFEKLLFEAEVKRIEKELRKEDESNKARRIYDKKYQKVS